MLSAGARTLWDCRGTHALFVDNLALSVLNLGVICSLVQDSGKLPRLPGLPQNP